MNEKEWDLAQEMLERYENASDQNLEAAEKMEQAVEEFGNQVQNLAATFQRNREYS